MKTKKIIAYAFIVCSTVTLLGMMKKKTGAAQIIEKEIKRILELEKQSTYFIKFHTKNFPVSKEVLEQFKTYTTAKEFEKSAVTKKPFREIHETETGTVWNITPYIQTFMPKMPTEKDWKLFTKLIDLLLDVASKKIGPYEITHANTLFMLIKVADYLRNKQVMQNSIPVLMKKLAGNLIGYRPARTFSDQVEEGERGPGGIILLPDTDRFLSYSYDGIIKLWDINQTKSIRTFIAQGWIRDLVPLPNTELFLSSTEDGSIQLWNINQQESIRTFEKNGEITNIILVPGTDLFLSSSKDGTIRLWDINQKESIRTFEKHGKIVDIILLPGTDQFLSSSENGTIRLWDINQKESIRTFKEHTKEMLDLVPLPDTDLFLSCSRDRTIKLWNINQAKSIRTFAEHTKTVYGINPLPGTDLFLSYSRDGAIKLWNINQTKSIRTFAEHTEMVSDLVLLPDTDLFLSYSKDETTKLWNINQTKSIRTFKTGRVCHITPIPKTDQFISDTCGGITKLWDINYKKPRQIYPDTVTHITLLPKNQQFLSFPKEGTTIELWDINSLANLTFEQVELCFSIFTSKEQKPFKITRESDNYKTLTGLPRFLQEAINKSNRLTIWRPQKKWKRENL